MGRFEDHVGSHGVFDPGTNGAAFVPHLVLENCDQPRLGVDNVFELLGKARLPSFEVRVEVGKDCVQGDSVWTWAVPVVHVFGKPLSGGVTVEAEALVQTDKMETTQLLREVGAEAAKEVGGDLNVVDNHPMLISIDCVVGRELRGRILNPADEGSTLRLRVHGRYRPEQWLVIEPEG